jgi:hypothetical protein
MINALECHKKNPTDVSNEINSLQKDIKQIQKKIKFQRDNNYNQKKELDKVLEENNFEYQIEELSSQINQ